MTVGPPPAELHLSDHPKMTTAPPGPNSRELLAAQSELEANTVAYPKKLPIALDSARGATIRDVDGNVYLDFFGGIGVANVGHSNPYVLEAAKTQQDDLVHTIDFPTEARVEFMEALDDIVPADLSGSSKVVFGGPTGTNAVEATIKLAKYNTGNDALVGFRGGYHGGTSGSLSLSAWSSYKSDYAPLLPDVVHAPYPYPFREDRSPEDSAERALEEIREIVAGKRSGIPEPAGIWVEPVQGSGGVVVPPEGFLSELAAIADENDVLLIADEIQTGIGRTGEWFASDHHEFTPDAITLGKAVGGIGLPLSATVFDESLDTWGPSAHAGTFRGHVPAMVAGTRAIEYIKEYNLLERAVELGAYLEDRLREAADGNPFLGEVRGQGALVGAEFVTTEGVPDGDYVSEVQRRCLNKGVIVWSGGVEGNVLRLLPPLVMTDEQARVGMDIVVDTVEAVAADRTA
ncbi:aspartate aminotransferase family protein [Natronomonas gomsonensis]|uniref:aspartate aminotransferase family protein n=1 Tax=Natronomonas gomsonensis TaxID=1046043 RepID=UPI0020CA7DDA|nr:aspartate aminotransferase family protein [Natronomonas gomsonensis]MCY4731566.1 aspartate aminotransferase family protein [Natronomonas gomsonensis]